MQVYNIKILYVEGEKSLRESFLYHYLEKTFETIVHAKNDDEALSLLRSTQFDIILIDFDLPSSNGLALSKSIKGRKISTPIILLFDINERLRVSQLSFVDRYFIKPLDNKTLFDVIKSLCVDSFIFDDICHISKINLHGNISYINSSFAKLLKVKKEDVIGKNYVTLLSYIEDCDFTYIFQNSIEKKLYWKGNIFFQNKSYYKSLIKPIYKMIIQNNETKSILDGYAFLVFEPDKEENNIIQENKKLKEEKYLLVNYIKSCRIQSKI